MNLQERLTKEMKEAMKAKETVKLSTIRLLKASIANAQIEKKSPLNDDEIIGMVQREIKKRKEAILEFKKAGRDELASKEEAEMKILFNFLPAQADDNEIKEVVTKIISDTPKDKQINIGMIMPKALEILKGKADGKRISIIAKEMIQ